jgi:NAD+ synthase (glutamine-hydrolysing)
VINDGQLRGVYHKALLPNYGVFDEDRYFVPGSTTAMVWDVGGIVMGISICEDIWVPDGPAADQAGAGAQVLVNINASPYHRGKGGEREALLADHALRHELPVVYLNLVGGQDELVFDGESMAIGPGGEVLYRAPQFSEHLFWLDVPLPARSPGVKAHPASRRPLLEGDPEPITAVAEPLSEEAEVYGALVSGLRDYVQKNGFDEVVVALSGGIDSALTATIAVDALGASSVRGITMPSRYSSEGSINDSRDLAERLDIRFDVIPIDPVFSAFLESLDGVFAGTDENVAEENLQARVRGAILMAVSNKYGEMVVATGNKSELAVGYATLYGDMAGGFAVLKDVYKTMVYRLAEWRNRRGEVIPRASIDKPPSAELRPGQLDADSLPPYEELDPILEAYIEHDRSVEDLIATGFDRLTVRRIARMVDGNEYKRRQAAPGVRISRKAFGRDRRLPITNRYTG